MFRAGLHLNRSTTLNKTDLRSGKSSAAARDRGQAFLSGNVASLSHHNVWFAALVIAGPIQMPMLSCNDRMAGVHVAGTADASACRDDHVDVVLASQTVIRDESSRVTSGADKCG